MKYQYLTVNTGHVSRHDTDVDLDPAIADGIAALLARGQGSIPEVHRPLSYRFTDSGGSAAVLSVTAGVEVYVWTAGFYLAPDRAYFDGMIELRRHAIMMPGAKAAIFTPPGLALAILPGAAAVGGEDMMILADFAKTMFSVWALARLGREAGK